ncbi:MAG: hypothetical protein HKN11_02015, partial [Rhizobiales bacterium]|nr:hypothetical protein [Hyphomicrobiales bacterium]
LPKRLGFGNLPRNTLTNEDESLAILVVDTKGRPLNDVFTEWIGNTKSTWQPWVDAAMK